MNFNKYFVFLAILVLCLLGQQAVEARHHETHHKAQHHQHEHKAKHDAHKVERVAKDVNTARKVIKVGRIIAGVLA